MKKDFILNFIAVAIPIAVLQLIVLPVVNSVIGSDSYGLAVSLIAVLNAIPVAMGNSLCNTRLLMEGTYLKHKVSGDFNRILILICGASFLIAYFCSTMCGYGWLDASAMGISGALMAVYNYQIVIFRLHLDYRGMLVSNIITAMAMLVGLALFFVSDAWQAVLILGYGTGVAYIASRTNVMRGGLGRTCLWDKTRKAESALLLSLVLSGLVNYGDRLVLLPLGGSTSVSIYYIASLVGKILVMVVSPMSTVVLSYVVRKSELKKESSLKLLGISSVIGLVFWGLTIILAPPILGLLYPSEVGQALTFVPIVTGVSVLQAQCSLLNPSLMRFYQAKWQVLGNALALVVLLVGGYLMSGAFGLMGFCLACFLSILSKLILTCVLILSVKSGASYETLKL